MTYDPTHGGGTSPRGFRPGPHLFEARPGVATRDESFVTRHRVWLTGMGVFLTFVGLGFVFSSKTLDEWLWTAQGESYARWRTNRNRAVAMAEKHDWPILIHRAPKEGARGPIEKLLEVPAVQDASDSVIWYEEIDPDLSEPELVAYAKNGEHLLVGPVPVSELDAEALVELIREAKEIR